MTYSPQCPPILFLVFNRLEKTREVFDRIREAQPVRLYIASDGARSNRDGESEKVLAVRDYILSNIDWPCSVNTLFSESNLGCKKSVHQAITWFFEHEVSGIILEDDCLPDLSFFNFCSELLERYKDDLRIWQICGNNFDFGDRRDPDYSYHFSYYGAIWGWATWRNRWKCYDLNIERYPEIKKKDYLWDLFGNSIEAHARIERFDKIMNIDTWDFQWSFTRFINSGLAIMPKSNLVTNLGFGSDATHTHSIEDLRANMKINSMAFPLIHPPFVIRDKVTDDLYFSRFILQKSRSSSFFWKIQKLLLAGLKKYKSVDGTSEK
jgi:hypothetical protein